MVTLTLKNRISYDPHGYRGDINVSLHGNPLGRWLSEILQIIQRLETSS